VDLKTRCHWRRSDEFRPEQQDKETIYLNHSKARLCNDLIPLRDFKTVYVSDGFQSLGRQKSLDARMDLRREGGSTGRLEG
jgi:hypothetical protein